MLESLPPGALAAPAVAHAAALEARLTEGAYASLLKGVAPESAPPPPAGAAGAGAAAGIVAGGEAWFGARLAATARAEAAACAEAAYPGRRLPAAHAAALLGFGSAGEAAAWCAGARGWALAADGSGDLVWPGPPGGGAPPAVPAAEVAAQALAYARELERII